MGRRQGTGRDIESLNHSPVLGAEAVMGAEGDGTGDRESLLQPEDRPAETGLGSPRPHLPNLRMSSSIS